MIEKQIGRKQTSSKGSFKQPPRHIWVYFGSNETSSFGAGVCVIPPNSSNEMHSHGDASEVIYVIRGKMRLIMDGETAYLNQGDAVLIKEHQEHQIFNDSDTEELEHTFTFNAPGPADAIGAGYGKSDNFDLFPPEQSKE